MNERGKPAFTHARLKIDEISEQGVTFDIRVRDNVAFVHLLVPVTHEEMKALIEQYQKIRGYTMGFHVCEYCLQADLREQKMHPATSSGDVTLFFMDRGMGHKWVMPDMIVHYVRDHDYLPPQEFIDDVLLGQHAAGERWQTKSITAPTPARSVGYLSGDYPRGETPAGFLDRLQALMEKAKDGGDRRQTRGI